jgi:hypothetical protein
MAIISMGLSIEALWGYAYSPPNYLDREVDAECTKQAYPFYFSYGTNRNVYYRDPNYILHGLGYLFPSLSSNMAQQRMTIEAASVAFSNRKQPQNSTAVTP